MEFIRGKLEEAEDIAEVMELMQNLNIPTKECKTIEQMKRRILDHLLSWDDSHLASNEVW